MFDIGWWEFILCGIIALVVLGPERLPQAARSVGAWVAKARRAWFSLRNELEQEFEIQELRQQIQQTQQQLQQLQQPSLERVEALNEITQAYKASSSSPEPLPASVVDGQVIEAGSETEPVGFSAEVLARQQQKPAEAVPAPAVNLSKNSEVPRVD